MNKNICHHLQNNQWSQKVNFAIHSVLKPQYNSQNKYNAKISVFSWLPQKMDIFSSAVMDVSWFCPVEDVQSMFLQYMSVFLTVSPGHSAGRSEISHALIDTLNTPDVWIWEERISSVIRNISVWKNHHRLHLQTLCSSERSQTGMCDENHTHVHHLYVLCL